jgi:hypothetical protein
VGKIRRGGYLFIWWKGDHRPRHVHVHNNDGKLDELFSKRWRRWTIGVRREEW